MRLLITILMTLVSCTAASAGPDDFEIQSSSLPALKPGDKLEKGAKLVLPTGAKITFIDRTGAAPLMRDCTGLYDGPIELCVAKATGPSKTTPGATRGIVIK